MNERRCAHGRMAGWMTAENRGIRPLPDVPPCWIHLDDGSECNADLPAYDQLPEAIRKAIWHIEISYDRGRGFEEARDALAALLLPLLKDQARLDWLTHHPPNEEMKPMTSISREQIDLARSAPSPEAR